MNDSGERTAAGTVLMGRAAAFEATAVDDANFGATVSPNAFAPTHAATGNVTLASPAQPPGWRSTVLPKPKLGGTVPELVHSDRPRYERQKLLGEGGVGEVVQSIDNDIERTVAIKRLKTDMRAPGYVARFVEEIRTVGSMEHPNIVPIHDVGVDEEGQYYFVMKYVDGETLETIIERLRAGDRATHREFSFERRIEIFLGILEAVSYAHAKGIIHRDIKPANVMVGRYGEVTVMDWGIARVKGKGDAPALVHAGAGAASEAPSGASPFRTMAGTLIGTPAYMSPEQARAEVLDERSDVYSLSVLLHEMLCLTHYLEGATSLEAVLAGVSTKDAPFAALVRSPHQESVPAELAHYLRKGLAKDPGQRFPTVDAMIDRLRLRAQGEFPIQCPTTFTKRVTHRWVRFIDDHPLLGPLLFGVLVIAMVGAAIGSVLRAVG